METRVDETPGFPYDRADLPTAAFTPCQPGARAASTRAGDARVSIAWDDRPDPPGAGGSLLQRRLRAATLALMFAFGAYFARSLLLRQSVLPVTHGLMLLIYAGCTAALRRPRPIARLRALEVAIFAIAAAYLAAVQYGALLDLARQGDAAALPTLTKRFVLYTFVLVVIYGMLIPNTWRRAAWVVALVALAPALSGVLLRLTHPELGRFTRQVATLEQVSDNLLILTIGALLAVFGTQVINTLRAEAFVARQLAQYHLGEQLGAGGMGEVYRAEHRLLKRPCAIKLIRRERSGDPSALARFEREVRATAALSHPNTVEVYDYGRTEDGAFYYVMEYLPGLSLAELVDRHGPLPPGRAVYLLRQACAALAEAHAAGLVHRDLKPANLFSARRGGRYDVTKVLDFGLVQAPAGPEDSDSGLSRPGTILGTPHYMAPEQAAADRRLDGRCDLYALGAVAYFLLTGRAPFEGRGPVAAMAAHLHEPVEPPSRRRPGLPADLEAVILRCLAKAPAARYAGAEALEAALAACACAADWDARRAERWWHEAEPYAPPAARSAGDRAGAATG